MDNRFWNHDGVSLRPMREILTRPGNLTRHRKSRGLLSLVRIVLTETDSLTDRCVLPHACKLCARVFSRSDLLKKHEAVHQKYDSAPPSTRRGVRRRTSGHHEPIVNLANFANSPTQGDRVFSPPIAPGFHEQWDRPIDSAKHADVGDGQSHAVTFGDSPDNAADGRWMDGLPLSAAWFDDQMHLDFPP